MSALYLSYVLNCRSVLFQWNITLPNEIFGRYGNALTCALLLAGVYKQVESGQSRLLCASRHWLKVQLWFSLIAALSIYGVSVSNDGQFIFREAVAFLEMGAFLLLGADDGVWRALEKHLTIMFWLAVVLIFMYYQAELPDIYVPVYEPVNFRYTNSTGYLVRPLIGPGLLLGMWGLVRRGGGIWKVAQASALVGLFSCEVYLFKYRSEAAFTALALACFLLIRPMLEKRSRPTTSAIVVAGAALVLGYYLQSESWNLLANRQATEGDLMRYRYEEFEAYKADLGWTMLVGRGLGGSFDASALRIGEEGANRWRTLHFGLLVFTLKGGLPFLAIFLSFVLLGRWRRAPSWYANPYNLTAALLFPVCVVQYLVNPIALGPEALMQNLPAAMILARFGRRENVVSVVTTEVCWPKVFTGSGGRGIAL